MSDATTETEADFEFDPEELKERPRCLVAIQDGPTWHITDFYDEVCSWMKAGKEQGYDVELHSHQGQIAPGMVTIDPTKVSCIFEITEDRWKRDKLERVEQEQVMREQAARGGMAIPPGARLN